MTPPSAVPVSLPATMSSLNDSDKKPLSATNLASHNTRLCDLYLYNVYHKSGTGRNADSELNKAHFERGLDWEVPNLRTPSPPFLILIGDMSSIMARPRESALNRPFTPNAWRRPARKHLFR